MSGQVIAQMLCTWHPETWKMSLHVLGPSSSSGAYINSFSKSIRKFSSIWEYRKLNEFEYSKSNMAIWLNRINGKCLQCVSLKVSLYTYRHSVSWPVSVHDAWSWPDKIHKTNAMYLIYTASALNEIKDTFAHHTVQVQALHFFSEASWRKNRNWTVG